jgi:PIN domain nuclease of toxin-antitoxin system
MRLLLDTHIFLWYITAEPKLAIPHRNAIQDPSNEAYLSVASIWEAVIKYGLGKLELPEQPHLYLPIMRSRHQIASLAIEESALSHLAQLPQLHRDPFDRILVAQSLQYDLTLITVDPAVRAYPARFLPD